MDASGVDQPSHDCDATEHTQMMWVRVHVVLGPHYQIHISGGNIGDYRVCQVRLRMRRISHQILYVFIVPAHDVN